MNRARFIHSVTGERAALTATAGKRDRTWAATNSGAAIPVLIEALSSRTKESLIGFIPEARYRMTWQAGSDVQEGDRITYGGRDYMLTEVIDDSTRPTGGYGTGILTLRPVDA